MITVKQAQADLESTESLSAWYIFRPTVYQTQVRQKLRAGPPHMSKGLFHPQKPPMITPAPDTAWGKAEDTLAFTGMDSGVRSPD